MDGLKGGLRPSQPHGRTQHVSGDKPSTQGEEGNPPRLQGRRRKSFFWLLVFIEKKISRSQSNWFPDQPPSWVVVSMSMSCTLPGVHSLAAPPMPSTDSRAIPPRAIRDPVPSCHLVPPSPPTLVLKHPVPLVNPPQEGYAL